MSGLFGGSSAPVIPPAPQMPVIEKTPEPAPTPDPEQQRRDATRMRAERMSRFTTRRNTVIGDDSDTLG